ncbi:MAG TPA: indole-3-glycerol phosphate synthase TrpC [Cytophagales bacterium]|jgi:indole-3-glycerol phosphate synthase|nr:indole-3-glycerol phosphate synthase TrpC [Cytophagales bacterium]
MNILDKIIDHKRIEVSERKKLASIKQLEQTDSFNRQTKSLKESLSRNGSSGIIAEFKRQSPSKGVINSNADVEKITKGYVDAGAAGLSVLTDSNFFGGSSTDLIKARLVNNCPILRKDFIIDEYQIVEARSIGADVILLIAACLDSKQLKSLADFAHSLAMEVLLEVHSIEELNSNLNANVDLIGVNNRNLKTFEVSLDISKKLAEFIPNQVVKVSESGISDPATIIELRKFGYQGFLMGENFMKNTQPEMAAHEFIRALKSMMK